MECDICASKRISFVTCKKCEFKSCVKCTKTFILDPSRPMRASCMSCKVEWTKKDLVDNFSIGFVTGLYKNHRENILFEFEKALLPETIEFAQRVKRDRELNQIIQECDRDIMITNQQFGYPVSNEATLDFNLTLMDEIHRLKKIKYVAESKLVFFNGQSTSSRRVQQVAKRYFPCPDQECRGFVSVTDWKCAICNIQVCEHCLERETQLGNETHTCNPDTVETIKLMKSDSKNCPKCMSLIYRISGCPQMFCTMCHTAFDWVTGNIVDRGHLHNPHYFEYLRTHANANLPEVQECGAQIGYSSFLRRYPKAGKDTELAKIYAVISHLEHQYLPRINPADARDMNRDLRVKYILKEINEDNFKSELHRREKAREKKEEIYGIVSTFVEVIKDFIRKAYEDESFFRTSFHYEAQKMREYTNKSLEDNVERIFKCVIPNITIGWEMFGVYR